MKTESNEDSLNNASNPMSEIKFFRHGLIYIVACTAVLLFLATKTLGHLELSQSTSFKVNGGSESFDSITLDPTYLAPVSMRSDVVDYESYTRVFLEKFGLNVPDSAKKSKGSVTASSSSAVGWAYVSIFNSSTCTTSSAIEIGGMLSGTCVNTGNSSSYYISCSSDSLDIYRYSSKDCSSTYKTRSVPTGCQTGIESYFDDWLIDNGVDDDINDDTVQWSMNFQCSSTTETLPLFGGTFATYEAFYTGDSEGDDGTCTDAVMFEAWPISTCIPTHSDGSSSSCMFIDDDGTLAFCLWNAYDCPSACDKPRYGPTTCTYDSEHGDILSLWGMATY